MRKITAFLTLAFLFPQLSLFSQTTNNTIKSANYGYQKSQLAKIFLGWHYRKVWSTPIEVPTFYMDSIKGGLQLYDVAGDLQSVRLKFIDSSGQKYSFKMLDKDQSKFLSPFLRKTFIGSITRDLASALNPYAPLVISKMAPSTGIKVPKFNLYYLPMDNRYENNLKNIRGRLGYFYPSIKDPNVKYINTSEFLQKRFSKNNFTVDTIMFAKERLFNLLLGDFDRHRDQWDWQILNENNKDKVIPLVKDYDMSFSKFRDGLLPFLITKAQPIMQQFNGNIKTKSLEKTGSYLDHLLLSGLTKSDWLKVADSIKSKLTDSLLIESLLQMPDPVYNIVGKELLIDLQKRRQELDIAAEEMYDILNKKVVIAGSDKQEKAIVTRVNNNETSVKIVKVSKHGKEEVVFNRTFYANETKCISIYLLGDNDEFEVDELSQNKIRLKLYGGNQEDNYNISGTKGIIVYDTKGGNSLNINKQNKKKLSKKSTKFCFEREGY